MSLNYLTINQQKPELNARCQNLVLDGNLSVNSDNFTSFTPTINVNGGTTTYTLQRGRFVKIGKLYIIFCHIKFTTSGTGNLGVKLNISDFSAINVNLSQNSSTMAKGLLPSLSVGSLGLFGRLQQNTDIVDVFEYLSGTPANLSTGYTGSECELSFTISAISN